MPRPPGTFWSSFTVIERDSNNKATKVKCKFVLFFGAIILIVATGMPIVPMLLGEMGFWPMKQEWSSIWKLIKSKKMTTSPPSLQSTSMAVFFLLHLFGHMFTSSTRPGIEVSPAQQQHIDKKRKVQQISAFLDRRFQNAEQSCAQKDQALMVVMSRLPYNSQEHPATLRCVGF